MKIDNLNVELLDLDAAKGLIKGKQIRELDGDLELIKLQMKEKDSFSLSGAGKLTLGGEAASGYKILVFNSESDRDPDEIWNPKATPACLKHELMATVGAEGAVSAKNIKASVHGKSSIRLADYKPHKLEEKGSEALEADIANLKIAFRFPDVVKLAAEPAGEALVYQVLADFGFNLKLSWGEIFSFDSFALASSLFPPDTLVARLTADASVEFSVSLSDQLRMVVTGGDKKGWARIRFLKSKESEAAVKPGIDVVIGFDEKKMEQSLQNLIGQILGFEFKDVESLIGSLKKGKKYQELGEVERKIADLILKRASVAFESLLQWLEKELEKLKTSVIGAAHLKVEFGLSYEYRRTRTDEVLLEFQFETTAPSAEESYKELLVGNFQEMLNAQFCKVDSFLRTIKDEKRRAYGTWLSLGKLKVGSLTKGRFTEVVQHNQMNDRRRITFQCATEQIDAAIGQKSEPNVAVTAQMSEFLQNPHARDFRLSIDANWFFHQAKLSEGELRTYLDLAALWRAAGVSWLGDQKIADLLSNLKDKKVEFSAHLVIKEPGIRILLQQSAERVRDAFYQALGAAVYFREDYEARKSAGVRSCLYADVFRRAIDDGVASYPASGKECANAKYDKTIQFFDKSPFEGNLDILVQETIDSRVEIGHFLDAWKTMSQAFSIENEKNSLDTLRNGIQHFLDCADTPLRVRATGRMFVDLLRGHEEQYSSSVLFRVDGTEWLIVENKK